MADHPNVALLRRLTDALASSDIATADTLIADDVVWHEIGRAEPRRGKDELRAMMGEIDYTISGNVHDIVANDDHGVILIDASAERHGQHLDYRVTEIYHVRDGRITERWAFSDDTQRIADFFA